MKGKKTVAESVAVIARSGVKAPTAAKKSAARKSAAVVNAQRKPAGKVELRAPAAKTVTKSRSRGITWSILFDCPKTKEDSLVLTFGKRSGTSVRRRSAPSRAAIDFKCPSCSERHTIDLPFTETTRS
jgi:hypothetical protein